MIKIKRNCKEIEEKKSDQHRSKIGVKRSENRGKTGEKQGKNRGLRDFAASVKSALCCETISQPQQVRCGIATSLRNSHFAMKPFRSLRPLSAKIFAAAKPFFGTRVSQHSEPHFAVAKSKIKNKK